MGVFGIAEILRNLENPESRDVVAEPDRPAAAVARRFAARARADPARHRRSARSSASCRATARCSAPFASYTLEKKLAEDPSRFGKGAIEGVAGPEAANNAGAQTAFIPLLTLGIPPNAVMALMVGAMTIHGIIPGPQVMTKNPDLFWGMIASMWIGNLMLLIINLPLIGLWVRLLKVPYRLMFPAILLFCCIGIYSINNNPADVYFTAFFGFVGYVLIKLGFEPAPLLLGFVLGRLMEEKLRQALGALARQLHDLRRAAGLGGAAGAGAGGHRDRGAAGACARAARRPSRNEPASAGRNVAPAIRKSAADCDYCHCTLGNWRHRQLRDVCRCGNELRRRS